MNTGGPAFPVPDTYHPNGQVQFGSNGMTLLDWYAGQESIGDEDLMMSICEHHAGPRPHGDWKTNVVEWYEWEARWRAGVKYMRASAMLAEKARREAVVQESSITQDDAKMIELQDAKRELLSALEIIHATLSASGTDLTGRSVHTLVGIASTVITKHKGAA